MKAKIVKIGNSRGIRIPKNMIEDLGFSDEVEITKNGKNLMISRVKIPREIWDSKFKEMAKNKDDREIINSSIAINSWDDKQWQF